MLKTKIHTRVFTVFIAVSFILQVLIAGVPIVTASESHSKGDAETPWIDAFPHNWSAQPPVHVRGLAPAISSPLSPAQIKTVYNLPSTGGSGTIAIIDAFDNPNVESDLGIFSSQFGLLPCTTANGCFEKHMMSSSIATESGWGLEISLDTQWAHAIAPNAKILLVEANSNSGNDLLAAVDYARGRSDVEAISMSWGGSEFSGESSLDYHFTSTYGAIFFASSGDGGHGVSWPSVSSNVVGVGGTTLTFSGGSLVSETAWSGSGGGLSVYETEPQYQVKYSVSGAGLMRAVPDVSYNADYQNSPVWVYDTFGYPGWLAVGGTSAGAPQWAAIQSLGLSTSNNNFYQDAKSVNYPSYFRDITSGSNGVCGFYCTAGTGYDYVTGLGSPLTINYNPTPTATPTPAPSLSVSANPSTITTTQRSTITASTSDGQSGVIINFVTSLGSFNSPSCTSDSTGKCSVIFRSSATGTARITASKSGYTSGSTTVTVRRRWG
ncbi:MAG: hypothetical protein ABOK23_06645 [Candidatus Methanoperedens sp.]|nr:hypothetical protein [Candidatus Methanoperedens sp.]